METKTRATASSVVRQDIEDGPQSADTETPQQPFLVSVVTETSLWNQTRHTHTCTPMHTIIIMQPQRKIHFKKLEI